MASQWSIDIQTPSKPNIFYIKIRSRLDTYRVEKRYRDFEELDMWLREYDIYQSLPPLPRNLMRHHFSAATRESRRSAVKKWVRALLKLDPSLSNVLVRHFFELPIVVMVQKNDGHEYRTITMTKCGMYNLFDPRLSPNDPYNPKGLGPVTFF